MTFALLRRALLQIDLDHISFHIVNWVACGRLQRGQELSFLSGDTAAFIWRPS
jgi:hypothetical protein